MATTRKTKRRATGRKSQKKTGKPKGKKKSAATKKTSKARAKSSKKKVQGKRWSPGRFTIAQIEQSIRDQILQNSPTPGAEIPISLLRSLYKPASEAGLLSALTNLQTEGLITLGTNDTFTINAPGPAPTPNPPPPAPTPPPANA